ncbi:MAG: hypothetical protein O6945_16000 [Gammaproteobacteria bacterium]|nr:hypothetical protein [Gammaproteobacteria bacterium]
MKLKIFYLVAFVFFPCMAIADGAISTMASVLSELNHFPSATDKEALTGIVEDASSTADEKMLAQIISRIAHKASAADKAELQKILVREGTSQAARAIATAAVNINHKLQSDDMQALKALID